MKRNILTALFTLCLMLLLLPTSAEAARSYTLPEVHKKDTVRWSKLYDVETEKSISFQYEIPKDGAAVLIFYKTSCGNSQAAFTALNQQSWVNDSRINFYAVESTNHSIADIRAFQKKYASNITDAVTWMDSASSSIAFNYLSAAGTDSNTLTFPLVVVCTMEKGVKTIRAAEMAVTDIRYLGNTLEQLLNADLNVEKPVPLTVSVVENHDFAGETLTLLNQYRQEQGVAPLHPNKKLTELAMLRAAELVICPDPFSRPDDTYNYDVVWDNLPNITTGNGIVECYYDDPHAFLDAISNNSFFNYLLLNDGFTQFGVGCVKTGQTYYWSVMLTDDNGYEERPCQTGLLQTTYTIPTYLSNLPNPGLYPNDVNVYPGSSTELHFYSNAEYADVQLQPTTCDNEIKDSSGKTIAAAALQADGSILVTASAVGTGELRVYGWEGQEQPFTAKITVSDDPKYRPNKLHTTVKGNGQITLSHETAIADTNIQVTITPDEGWWLGALHVTDADGNPVMCYSTLDEMWFSMPMSDTYITAEFLPDTVPKTEHAIGWGSKGNGSISIVGNDYMAYATTTVTVIPTAEEGYVLHSLTVADREGNDIEVTANANGSYSFIMPDSTVVIHTSFVPIEGYTVNILGSSNCTVTASPTNAKPDEYVIVQITPHAGYEIQELQINLWDDEYSWLDDNTIRFPMPEYDVEISVYCKPSPISSGSFGDGLTWNVKDGTLTISGNGSMDDFDSTFELPWDECRDEIQTVVIDEGVTDIAPYAFSYMDNLTAVTIPASVEYIDSWAFLNAEALTDISFVGSAPSRGIDSSAFANVSAFVTVPDNDPSWTAEITEDYGGSLMWNHSWSAEVTEPTCTEEGYTEYTCICGDSQQDTFTPELGHSYTNGACHRCGETDPDYTEPISNPFTDVAETDWFYHPVLWAVENKVTGGKTATTFAPNEGCTRAQVVTFLWAANGKPTPETTENKFTDVAESDWYYNAVLWAVENGITTGISATEFGPEQTCTRAQIVTFLYAAANKPDVTASSSFDDVKDSDWYAKPVIWAKANDITGGISATEFGPNNICTRAQVVTFLYKASLIQ